MDTSMLVMDGFTLAGVLLALGFTGLIALLFLHQQKFVRWSSPFTRVIACWMVIALLLGGYLKSKPVDSVPYENCANMSVSDVQDWFVEHKEGKWAEHKSAFSKLDGKELCAMVKEDFLQAVPGIIGSAIYNNWRLATTPPFRRELSSVEFEIWVGLGILLVVLMGYLYYKSFVSELRDSDEAVEFWNALPSTVPSVGTIFKVPRLGAADELESIFVRQCYQDLAQEIYKCRLSAIVGTPGIGKSLFLQYFVAFLRARHIKRIILARPIEGMVYMFDEATVGKYDLAAFYQSDAYVRDISTDNKTWFLFDATSSERESPRECACNMVVATSTKKNDNTTQIMKSIYERKASGRFYMPVWNWLEIESFGLLNSEDIQTLLRNFKKFGGVARFLFSSEKPSDALIQKAVARIKNTQELINRVAEIDNLSVEDGHLALHVCVPTANYKESSVMWASEEIEALVMQQRNQDVHWARINFVKETKGVASMATARGQTFEILAHERLLRGGVFDCKVLGSRDTFRLDLPENIIQHCSFHAFNDIASVQDNVYYEPDYRTFPAIDSAMHRRLFQMTVGATHTINLPGYNRAVEKFAPPLMGHQQGRRVSPRRGAHSIRATVDRMDYIFVLPRDVYDQWQEPQAFVENGRRVDGSSVRIRQIALCLHV